MAVAWAVILALILITAFYVAAEFAAVGARRSRLRRLAEDGHRLAQRVLPIIEDSRQLDRYIAVSQIGITLSSLVLGAYGQATLAVRLEPALVEWADLSPVAAASTAAMVVLIGLTTLGVILGELVPKSIALQYPTRTAIYTVAPMQWSAKLFAWFIAVLNGSGALLLRLLGARSTGHRHIHSPEEIELLIAESRDGGLLEPIEQQRLHRALRLGLRSAGQLMVPRNRISAIDIDRPASDIVRAVAASPYTRLPAYRTTLANIVGVLHTKDLVLAYTASEGGTVVERVVRPVVKVPESMPADRLLAMLREHRTHQVLVVDERGTLKGLLTLEDVLGELLGDVADEFKTVGAAPQPIGEQARG